MELTKLSPAELKNLLANSVKQNRDDLVHAVLREMQHRGIARKGDYKYLTWNQDSVRKALEPFVAVAKSVHGNMRTSYTQAGGARIGKSKNDPEWFWIDTYSAIKTPAINALIVCYIKRPGDEPEFQFHINGEVTKRFNADQLSFAKEEWTSIAEKAKG